MRDFAKLLDGLVYTRSRNAKLKLIADYLRTTPDPDRGWAMAAMTGAIDIKAVKSAAIHQMVAERVDPELFAMSRDFVGDLAEARRRTCRSRRRHAHHLRRDRATRRAAARAGWPDVGRDA